MLLLFLGGIVIGLVKGARTGDWSSALKESGGRIFSLDTTLSQEADFLIESDHSNILLDVFHLLYAFASIFILFSVAFLLFKVFNWSIGIKQFSPSSDLIIIALIVLILLLAQFLYTYFILDETIVPLSGTFKFFKSLPMIINQMTI